MTVKPAQQHSRLTHIASYLQWLWQYLSSTGLRQNIDQGAYELDRMVHNILGVT
jgi:hypothetical protein